MSTRTSMEDIQSKLPPLADETKEVIEKHVETTANDLVHELAQYRVSLLCRKIFYHIVR